MFTESGQGLVEYALILVFVSIVLVVVLSLFGTGIANAYSNIISNIP
ncbi:MAG: Flp family type IVb pilin [Anaerolineales bacterium]|jgi:Flp pilus assembly pilin Flp|nr:Flp family type IVb pilin [Anaerolineales bacterium]